MQLGYTGYFPTGFNVVSNRPNEAVTVYNFTSVPVVISNNEACLAFDYVLVNGTESSVTLEMVICNEKGQEVNRVGGVEVPSDGIGLLRCVMRFLPVSSLPASVSTPVSTER